jgi:RNA polymerase sigma-70 factor (ECF subfamily)
MDDRGQASSIEGDLTVAFSHLDANALTAVAFDRYHAELYSFLRRATRDEPAAEDLLQDAFLRLTIEARADRTPDNIRAWLYAVAANLVVSRGRRRSTVLGWLSRQRATVGSSGTSESAESSVIKRERRRGIEIVLDSLPADARTALLLAGEGFRGREIAEAIGRSYAATRTLMTRARIRVRVELETLEDRG